MPDLTLAVPGARLAYDVAGSGPVLVQLHGLSSSRERDLELGIDLSPVTSDRTLVRYDARAHGASTGQPEPNDYRWDALAGDLLALLEVVAPDEPVDAFGASMGVGTLLHAVVRAPDRFRRLVLALPPTAWETRLAQADGYRAAADLVAARGVRAFTAAMAELSPPPAAGDLAIVVQVSDALFPAVLRGAALTDLPQADALTRIGQPTLLLPWSDDPGHPVSTAERLLALLPDATMELARTPADVAGWGARTTAFVADSGPDGPRR